MGQGTRTRCPCWSMWPSPRGCSRSASTLTSRTWWAACRTR